MASFSIGSKGYICAGLDSVVRKDLWEYDPALDSWSQLADLPASERRNPVAFSLNGMGYVGTGHSGVYSSTGVILKDFWQYDPVLNAWTQKADYPGANGNGVYFGTAFSTDNYGYIACGKKGTSSYENDLWQYDDINDSWTQKANFPGGDRYNLMSFVINNIGYVGFGSDQDIFRKDLWAYDELTDSWTQKADCEGVARAAGGTFSLQDRGFICCGADGGFKEDLWEYDPFMDRWKIRAYFPTDGRRYGLSLSINNKGYFGAGKGSFGKKRSMYEYTPMTLFGWMMEELSLESILKPEIVIYPNPSIDKININWNKEASVNRIVLSDIKGETKKDEYVSGESLILNVSNYSAGIYFVSLIGESNDILSTEKIVIQ